MLSTVEQIFLWVFASEASMTIIALIPVGWAFYLYRSSVNQARQDSALVLYLDIKNIESIAAQIERESTRTMGGDIGEFAVPFFDENEWDKQKISLIQFFDSEQIDIIEKFYRQARIAEDARQLKYRQHMDGLSAKGHAVQQVLAKAYVDEAIDKLEDPENFDPNKHAMIKEVIKNDYSMQGHTYVPDEPQNRLRVALLGLPKLANSPTGEKLKSIAKIK